MIPLKGLISSLNSWFFEKNLSAIPDNNSCIIELKFIRKKIFYWLEKSNHFINFHIFSSSSFKMFLVKDSLRNLSKLTNRNLSSFSLSFCFVKCENIMFITLIVKQVIMLFCYIMRSFISKDQIDPIMKIVTYIFTLKYLSHLENKLLWSSSPWRKIYWMNLLTFLFST